MPGASADQISRAVLRSQPPHADDVPAMVAYNAKFGGSPNGIWINDLIHYCTLAKVPAEIHIPGRLFEVIAKPNFDTVMPGRSVTAGRSSYPLIDLDAVGGLVAPKAKRRPNRAGVSQFGGRFWPRVATLETQSP